MRKFLTLVLLLSISVSYAQDKQSLTWDDVVQWSRITEKQISDDGKYVIAVVEPWKGDGVLQIFDNKANKLAEFTNAKSAEFLNNTTLIFKVKPLLAEVENLERSKNKASLYDKLVVYNIVSKEEMVVDSLGNYKVSENGDYLSYKREGSEILHITNLDKCNKVNDVDKYAFSKDDDILVYTTKSDSINTINIYDLEANTSKVVYSTAAEIKTFKLAEQGELVAFVVGCGKDKKGVTNKLYIYNESVKEVAVPANANENWIVNQYAKLSFSEDNSRLFFGTSPEFFVIDTTLLKSQKSVVDIWTWNEPVLYTQQLFNKKKDSRKSYKAVYSIENGSAVQLADQSIPTVVVSEKGNGNLVIAQTDVPYKIETLWDGHENGTDLYIVDIKTGDKEIVKKDFFGSVEISPDSKYMYWYQPLDSVWVAYGVDSKKENLIATNRNFGVSDDLHDTPDSPSAWGELGWSEDDAALYVYGKYDIWKLDPSGAVAPKNVTVDGKQKDVAYRAVVLDKDKTVYEQTDQILLRAVNYASRDENLVTMRMDGKKKKTLLSADMMLGGFAKADDSDAVIYTKQTFEKFPNIFMSDMSFKTSTQITNVNAQQSEFNWGTVEQVKWVSLAGDTLSGLLFKPENFDPNKKYPLICNFYEKDSHNRYKYRTPEPHRSTIDYHYYTSNEYVIFNPDIVYYDGYPGRSCYDAVMPGLDKVVEMGFIDEKRIGAQGHSWGGYQVAHLAVKTDRFAAIESGAPVVNMLSAYGGIRWGSGLNRAFQYEMGQSRIGKTIWDAPELYLENSPLMEMDKVRTPILIMHNDQDGHVPWAQGVEYFISLRRLQQPVWMLNYNNEPHWPTRMANKVDFQVRMSQFFNHYLKGDSMPKWMKDGVQAIHKQ